MQANLVQFLTGATPAGAAGNGAESKGSSDLFSQMLGDAAMQGGKQQGQSLLKPDMIASALLAQEMDPQKAVALGASTEQLSNLLSQKIGPEEARALLEDMAAMGEQGFGQEPAFDQLQQALEQVEANGDVVEVAELLEQLPAAEEAATPAERAPLMQRMLNWMHGALERTKEGVPQLVQPGQDGTALSLQATLFPAGHDAAEIPQEAVAAAAPKPAQESAEIEIEAAAWEEAAPAIDPVKTTVQAAPVVAVVAPPPLEHVPAWVRKLGQEPGTDTALDDAIAPLSQALGDAPEADEGLPELNLPGSTTAKPVADAAARPATPAFAEQLKPLTAALADVDAVSAPVVDAVGTSPAIAAPASTGHSAAPLHTPAPHAAALPTPHYVNHAPVTEQVHVAVTQATRDGIDHITLQLEPADLGRVEVKMDIALDGKAQLSFVVDKSETLDALSRDARGLERALQEAGVKADAGSMQFNLRQQPQSQFGEAGGEGDGQQAANDNQPGEAAVVAAADGITTHYTINVRDGVDIRA